MLSDSFFSTASESPKQLFAQNPDSNVRRSVHSVDITSLT